MEPKNDGSKRNLQIQVPIFRFQVELWEGKGSLPFLSNVSTQYVASRCARARASRGHLGLLGEQNSMQSIFLHAGWTLWPPLLWFENALTCSCAARSFLQLRWQMSKSRGASFYIKWLRNYCTRVRRMSSGHGSICHGKENPNWFWGQQRQQQRVKVLGHGIHGAVAWDDLLFLLQQNTKQLNQTTWAWILTSYARICHAKLLCFTY